MWKLVVALVAVLALLSKGTAAAATQQRASAPVAAAVDKETADKVKNLERTVESLGRQLMQQQTFVEERIRSDGMSGIKALRHIHSGTKAYHGDNHIGGSALSCHDHADYDRTIGLGEFAAVMNGVEFRTRHNDYKFKRPAHNHDFNAVEDIPFPPVPGAVSNKRTMTEKVEEMRKWFKAFKDQDHSVRDYRKFFKPNLCYLEGAWTLNAKTLQEPFSSDRHHLDASSWFDLQEKIRFTSYAGSKSNLENFAFLPTIMYNITDGVPQFAQWNYRILCHPLSQDIPTSYFALQDDLSSRVPHKYTWERMPNMRAARYKLNEFGTDRYNYYSFLDSLMAEIPGKNNYGANLTDDAFDLMNYDVSVTTKNSVLNTGMYHRWFKLGQRGAMGLTVNHRGYHDENMWVAMTTQPNVMPLSIKHCVSGKCSWATRRVSYAIPLEIVYSTPLNGWNPYGLKFHEHRQAYFVERGGRGGQHNVSRAYNGTSFRKYYRTPVEFYQNGNVQRDPADTAKSTVYVLDPKNQMRAVSPTGFRIITPEIQDVGKVRLRYPIFPVHSEGSTVGQELMALKDMVMKMGRYQSLYEETPMGQAVPMDQDKTFHLRDSGRNPPGLHGHDFTLTSDEYNSLVAGNDTTVTTSFNLGHQHELVVYYNKNSQQFYYRTCDGQRVCWDHHGYHLDLLRI